jgi:hypothetical protein
MANSNSVIYRYFYDKNEIPNGLISYWKNNYDSDGSQKLPPFPVRLYRQIACRGYNDFQINFINSFNLWKTNISFLNKQFILKFEPYETILREKNYLFQAFNLGNLKFLPKEIVFVYISCFI